MNLSEKVAQDDGTVQSNSQLAAMTGADAEYVAITVPRGALLQRPTGTDVYSGPHIEAIWQRRESFEKLMRRHENDRPVKCRG